MVRLPVSGFTRSDFTVCWLLTFILPDKISKPENQSRHERTVKILQDLDEKIYNLRNTHILRHHNFQLFYHCPLLFNAILLSLLRTNTSSHHFENPCPIAADVTCERSLKNQTITKINRPRPFGKSDLILWLLHQICRWKCSALLANFRIQTIDRFQTQQNAQETQ